MGKQVLALEKASTTPEKELVKPLTTISQIIWNLSKLGKNGRTALESCITTCNYKDHLLDFQGKSFEETRETYEEAKDQGMNSQRPVPCPQCCEKIPKSLGDIQSNWPQIAGTCNIAANDDANLGI